jgi:hypothetical protein
MSVSPKPRRLAKLLTTALLIPTILTGATEAATRKPVCVFEVSIFGTGAGILCEQAASPSVVDTACQAFEPIRYSKTDSAETVRQIRGHNAAWDALCKGKTPGK